MKRYFDIILKHRFTTLTILIAITIFLGYGLKDLEFDSSFESIMPKKDADFLLNEEVKKIYGNNGKFIIINMPVESMQPDELQDFEKIHRDIEEYKNYNALKESSRLIKLNEQFSKKVVRYDELINNFSDDPEYQRTIARKIIKVFGKKYELNKNDYKKLEKELLRANKIKADEYVDLIVSPFTVKDLVGKDDTLTAFDLIEEDNNKKRIIPTTVEDISLFKKRLYNNPAFAGGIYVKNAAGDITDFGLMIRLKESFIYDPIIYEVEEIAKSYQNRNLVIQGLPVTYKFVNNYMESDLKIFLPLVTLVMIIVFFLNFKTTIGVLLPLSTLILSDIWILGLMGHLGFKLTVIGISLPPLMVAVGSSYSIHIMNQYYIDIKNIYSNNKIEGLKESINHITATVLLAGLTTFAGFFSLVTNQVSALREWGFFASLGVLFAVIISITLIPIILTFLPAHQNIPDTKLSAKPNIVDKLVPHIVHLVLNKTKLVIIITIVAVIISLIGTSMLVVETCIQAYFKKNDVVLTSADIIDIKYGGTYGLNILLNTGKKDGVKDPEFLKFIENFRLWLIAEENNDLHIGRTDSFTDFIKTMNLAMHDNNYTYYSIPDKQIDIESYIDVYRR